MSFEVELKEISLEGETDFITLSNLICKGIFDQKFPIAKYFKDYEIRDDVGDKVKSILEKLEKQLTISKPDHQFLTDILATLFFKLKSDIVELVERTSMAEQGLIYRDKILKDKEERHHSQIKFFVNKIKELEKENKSVQDKNAEIKRLSINISTLSLSSIELEDKFEAEKKKNKNIQSELNIVKSRFQKEINELKNEKQKQYEKIIELEKNISSSIQIIKNNNILQSAYNELETKYNLLQNNFNEQEDNFKDLNSKYKIEIENKKKLDESVKALNEKNSEIVKLQEQINRTNDFEEIILNKDSDITKLTAKLDHIQKKYDELLIESKIMQNDKNNTIKKNKFNIRNNYQSRGFGHKNGYTSKQNHQMNIKSGFNDHQNNNNPVICYVPVPVQHTGFQPFPMNRYEQPYEPCFVPYYQNYPYTNEFYDENNNELVYDDKYQNNSNQLEDNVLNEQEIAY